MTKQRQRQQFKVNSSCEDTVYRAIIEEDKFLMCKDSPAKHQQTRIPPTNQAEWEGSGGK